MFGIKVENSSGNIQIDSTNVTYRVFSRGRVSPGNAHPRLPTDGVLVVRSLSGGELYPVIIGGVISVTSSSGIEYLILRPANLTPASSESFGLRVWNESSGLVYDSGNIPVEPIANVQHSVGSSWQQETVSYLSMPRQGRDRFVDASPMLRWWGFVWAGNPGQAGLPVAAMVTALDTSLRVRFAPIQGVAPPYTRPPIGQTAQVLVIDVIPE